jgi:predicted TIM-barrel fold metal-dependent hydrolase
MDAAGVDAALIQPPAWDPDANRIAVEAARAHPRRFAVLGNFGLARPRDLEGWKRQSGMLGLRFIFNEPQHARWLEGEGMEWLWSGAARLGIPIALAAAAYLPQIGKLAARHPSLRLIVDHLGVPLGAKGDTAFRHIDQLEALARHPNVAVKATGVPAYAEDGYPYRSIHGHLRRIYDAFGPRRFFWGTDITKMPCTWRQCVTLFTEELPWLDHRWVMGDALCEWIGWRHEP